MPADEDAIFRPPWYALAFWFGMGGAMLLFGIFVIGPILHGPRWVVFLFIGMPALSLAAGVVGAFASVRVGRGGIAHRSFRPWAVQWPDVEAWSQLGPGGSVFLRARDGRVRGFNSWCVYGARSDRLARALEEHVGPALTGRNAVMPGWLRGVFGGLSAPGNRRT